MNILLKTFLSIFLSGSYEAVCEVSGRERRIHRLDAIYSKGRKICLCDRDFKLLVIVFKVAERFVQKLTRFSKKGLTRLLSSIRNGPVLLPDFGSHTLWMLVITKWPIAVSKGNCFHKKAQTTLNYPLLIWCIFKRIISEFHAPTDSDGVRWYIGCCRLMWCAYVIQFCECHPIIRTEVLTLSVCFLPDIQSIFEWPEPSSWQREARLQRLHRASCRRHNCPLDSLYDKRGEQLPRSPQHSF